MENTKLTKEDAVKFLKDNRVYETFIWRIKKENTFDLDCYFNLVNENFISGAFKWSESEKTLWQHINDKWIELWNSTTQK